MCSSCTSFSSIFTLVVMSNVPESPFTSQQLFCALLKLHDQCSWLTRLTMVRWRERARERKHNVEYYYYSYVFMCKDKLICCGGFLFFL